MLNRLKKVFHQLNFFSFLGDTVINPLSAPKALDQHIATIEQMNR